MKNIKQIIMVCGYHYSKWVRNKRILLAFLLAGIMSFLLTEKVVNFSFEKGTILQVFEPFVWTFGDRTSILLAALILLLLFADMPFLDGEVPYVLIRSKISIWTLGQILYLVTATFLYAAYLVVITAVFCMKNAFIGNKWSSTAALLGYSDYSRLLQIPAKVKTFEITRPYQCTATIFLLLLAYILFSVLLMMLITIKRGKKSGIIAIFVFHMWGLLLNVDLFASLLGLNDRTIYKAYILCGWLSPLNHVTYPMHNFGYDALPTMGHSFIFYGIGIIGMIVAIMHEMKRYNFKFIGAEVF